MNPFKGCGTALVTPFKEGAVDYETYAALVDRQVAAGVDFLVPLATTSEAPVLSMEEKINLLTITKEHACGKPLLVGCGSNSLEVTLANIEALSPLDPDGYLVVVPFYNKPNQEGQYLYFKAVAQSTDKPIVIYNVPGRTGVNMLPSTVARLASECKNIVAVKEASNNYLQACEIILAAPEGFSVLSGDDDLTFAIMATGGDGVISVASNVVPAEVVKMVNHLRAGEIEDARKLHLKLCPLFRGCFTESNPIPVKEALNQMGLCSGEMRLPLAPASQQTKDTMKKILSDLWK